MCIYIYIYIYVVHSYAHKEVLLSNMVRYQTIKPDYKIHLIFNVPIGVCIVHGVIVFNILYACNSLRIYSCIHIYIYIYMHKQHTSLQCELQIDRKASCMWSLACACQDMLAFQEHANLDI